MEMHAAADFYSFLFEQKELFNMVFWSLLLVYVTPSLNLLHWHKIVSKLQQWGGKILQFMLGVEIAKFVPKKPLCKPLNKYAY